MLKKYLPGIIYFVQSLCIAVLFALLISLLLLFMFLFSDYCKELTNEALERHFEAKTV